MGALALSLLLATSVAYAFGDRPAGLCEEKDFREVLGQPRMQDGTAWCYANSAADLISQAVGKRVSSIDIATTFLLANEAKLHKMKDKAVHAYLKTHPDFDLHLRETRRDDDAYKPDRILSPDGILDEGGRDDEAILLSNLKGLCRAESIPPGEENLEKYLQAIRDDYAKENKEFTPSPIGAIENDMAKIMARAFQHWVDQKCGKRFHPKAALIPHEVAVAESLDEYNHMVSDGKVDVSKSRAMLTAEIDRLLDSGKVAAIAYDSFDLYPMSLARPGVVNPHGDHSSVVVARKKIDGKCHYFVRNHFGATCGYRKEFEDHCEKENGGVWVTMDALKHLYSVTSVR